MAPRRKPQESKGRLSKFVQEFGEFLSLYHISPVDFSIFQGFEICGTLNAGWDVLLGSIAAFYVFMVPYTKVEESFNVQMQYDCAGVQFFFPDKMNVESISHALCHFWAIGSVHLHQHVVT
ncbi:hypothetical protein J5N97_029675 [Dioscorea zingiberensis]|uniref:Uncharacterized protein n=1 Tax=Dioscorea zingiberensis TaxID=325984 RepID=A0A9D5H3F3_9LILI|nr:hypothetical protein J5N97_029675 [Dioscorea zingiberensis]